MNKALADTYREYQYVLDNTQLNRIHAQDVKALPDLPRGHVKIVFLINK